MGLPVDHSREHLSEADVDALLQSDDVDAGPEQGPGIQGKGGQQGTGTTPAESRRRREVMSRMLAGGASEDAVIGAFSQLVLPDGSPGFGMSEIRIRALMTEVRAAWQDEDTTSKRYIKSAAVRRHLTHISKAAAKGQFAAVAMLEKNLAQMQGTMQPIKIDIGSNARVSEAVMNVLGEIDPVEIRRLVDEETKLLKATQRVPEGAIVASVKPREKVSKSGVESARRAVDALDVD